MPACLTGVMAIEASAIDIAGTATARITWGSSLVSDLVVRDVSNHSSADLVEPHDAGCTKRQVPSAPEHREPRHIRWWE